MLSSVDQDVLLLRLFARHFSDPVAAMMLLDKSINQVQLPFNLRQQIRELQHPPQPDWPEGTPSLIYYYIPGSGWGSWQKDTKPSTQHDFVYATDGIGLNLGCPVRLIRALDVLLQLSAAAQREPRTGLGSATKHLSTVEELLWLRGWKSMTGVGQGVTLPGGKGNTDWTFKSQGTQVHLEAKFRPSDWPRLTDQGTFVPIKGGLLKKAAHKFPKDSKHGSLHLVGITAYQNITLELMQCFEEELLEAPQIHAVIFRSLAQMTHIISIHEGLCERVLDLLNTPACRDYPWNYMVCWNIQDGQRRVAESRKQGLPDKATPTRLYSGAMKPEGFADIRMPEPGLYRMEIPSYGNDGEPNFKVIPKYLMPD